MQNVFSVLGIHAQSIHVCKLQFRKIMILGLETIFVALNCITDNYLGFLLSRYRCSSKSWDCEFTHNSVCDIIKLLFKLECCRYQEIEVSRDMYHQGVLYSNKSRMFKD